jgi:hypothetical protein
LALPPKLARSPLLAMIQPPCVILTSQSSVLAGGVHVFVASPNGSPAFCVPLLLVSAKAWIASSPGSDAE